MKKSKIKSWWVLSMLIFSIASFAQKPVLTVNAGHSDYVSAVCYSPHGKFMLSGSFDGTLKLWEIATGKELRTFSEHTGLVCSVCFSPDGKYALSGSWDHSVKLWDVATGKELKSMDGHCGWVLSVGFSPDGKYAISGCDNWIIKLWDLSTGQELKTFAGHKDFVNSVCFSPDGKYVLSGSDDKTIKLWEISSVKEIKSFSGITSAVKSVCFSPDGKFALSGGEDKNVTLWKVSSGKAVKILVGHTDNVNTVSFSPDGLFALSGSDDASIKLWNISTSKILKTFAGSSKTILSVSFSPNGKFVLAGGNDPIIRSWEIATGQEIKAFSGYSNSVRQFSFSPNGNSVIVGCDDGTLKLWDITTGKTIRIFKGHTSAVNSVCYSPDGMFVISASIDGIIILWDIADGKELKTFIANSKKIQSVCFSPDGKSVLTGGDDNIMRLWNVSTGELIRSFEGHTNRINSVCFSHNGKYALSSSCDFYVKLWNISTSEEIRTMYADKILVAEAAFSPDDKYILSGGAENSMKLWDSSSGELIRAYIVPSNKVWSAESVWSSCFSPDGKFALSGTNDGYAKLWDISTGNLVKTFTGHTSVVSFARFSPDGKTIMTCSQDKSIKIWDVDSGNEKVSLFSYNNDWLAVTPDMYFDCSIGGSQSVSMVLNNHGYNIDQFALKNNRPDIILQRLGSTDNELIRHYYSQYKKRLRKSGFTEEKLSSEIHVPIATITDTKPVDKFVTLNFSLNDDKFALRKYNIYVNDVPLFGAYGKDITGQNNLSLSENIELTSGTNKIEISCINEKGAESFRALTYANYNETVKGDLYYIGFGVSKYQNPAYNLAYADKDAMDLSKVIDNYKGKGFENVYTKILVNEQVTPEAIKASKDFVKNAKPDDTFILFIAGHGMHDTDPEATYYYLTYNADIKNLKTTAANFETIEDLLQGIPPRNKLFLMDACESGEIDDEDQGQMLAAATGSGMASRGFKTTGVIASGAKQSATKHSYLFQKDRYIYNDLARRSGAIVYSSSKGGEFSYERSDIKNGLFTKSIITALTTNVADKNNDGIVSTDELREYVTADVAKTSNDLQHPTVDRDNIYQKFGFEVVK